MSSLGDIRIAGAKDNIVNSFFVYSIDAKFLDADTVVVIDLTVTNLTTTGTTILHNTSFTGAGVVPSISFSFSSTYTIERKIITASATGSNTIYTVPAGFKMMPMNIDLYNATGGALTWWSGMTRSAVDYQLTATQSIAASVRGASLSSTVAYSAGDIWLVNTSGAMYIIASYFVFPDTVPIQTYPIVVTNTPVVLFTAPSTPTTNIYYGIGSTYPSSIGQFNWTIKNGTGGTLIYTTTYTPSGGSPATISTNSITTTSAAGVSLGAPILPGDSISITSAANTANQFASTTIFTKTV